MDRAAGTGSADTGVNLRPKPFQIPARFIVDTLARKCEDTCANMNPGTSEYAVGWFTLCLINAGLAQAKGRGGLNWCLLSLFLGPLATLLIVVLDPVKKN